MLNNKCPLRRKTLKLRHPNPLFEKWLKEWRDEAASRNSDSKHSFGKALLSLKKYPLPLKTGKECLILENFGTRICLLLDRKLADYRRTHPEEECEVVHKPDEENEPLRTKESKKPPEKSNIQLNPTFQPEDNQTFTHFDFDHFDQKSTSTSSSQSEQEIFLPGSFQVILLVDTQEIHRGDDLVKALEAQGITLEVRNLKVGDFAWVSRNAQGQELLLPFIVERKRLDDLASSIKDGRFHEQKFRMKQSGVPNCMYLVESHGQRRFSLPTTTLLQAAVNTQFIDNFVVKYTANSHETVVYLATLTKVITRNFSNKTLIECKKSFLPTFDVHDDCISLLSFKEFNKLSGKTRKYCVKEMFIKQLVQLRGLSVEKALAIVERYPSPRSLMVAYQTGGDDKMLMDISVGNLSRKIGPVISKAVYELYIKSVLS